MAASFIGRRDFLLSSRRKVHCHQEAPTTPANTEPLALCGRDGGGGAGPVQCCRRINLDTTSWPWRLWGSRHS